jgi:hypothetical protein
MLFVRPGRRPSETGAGPLLLTVEELTSGPYFSLSDPAGNTMSVAAPRASTLIRHCVQVKRDRSS